MSDVTSLVLKVGSIFAVVVVVAAVLSSLPAGDRSPYVSALTTLATGRVAEAAAKCSNRTCDATGTRCVHLNGSRTDCGVGDFCREHACL